MPSVNYVAAGTYTFSATDKPASGSTYPVTKASGLVITGARNIDSAGLNLTNKDSEHGLTFSINSNMTVTITAKAKATFNAVGKIVTSNGTIGEGTGGTVTVSPADDSKSATFEAGTAPASGSLTAVFTLSAGSYELLGNTSSSTKILSITFASVE